MEALRKGEQGTVAVMLAIGSDGNVHDCTITSSSNSALLDAATCRILVRRAKFKPARDTRGNPMPDSFPQKVRWVLPNQFPAEVLPRPLVDETSRLNFVVRSGHVADCKFSSDGSEIISAECERWSALVHSATMRVPPGVKEPYRVVLGLRVRAGGHPLEPIGSLAKRIRPLQMSALGPTASLKHAVLFRLPHCQPRAHRRFVNFGANEDLSRYRSARFKLPSDMSSSSKPPSSKKLNRHWGKGKFKIER